MTTATITTGGFANGNQNENISGLPDIDSNATAVSSKSSNFANVSGFNDIDSNVTLSNFFDDIVMPDPKLRKEKPECFGCSG